jgi:hypothetical protein
MKIDFSAFKPNPVLFTKELLKKHNVYFIEDQGYLCLKRTAFYQDPTDRDGATGFEPMTVEYWCTWTDSWRQEDVDRVHERVADQNWYVTLIKVRSDITNLTLE